MRTKPEVYVNKGGVWYFRNNPIENESILNYFKKNLKRDSEGHYFIENKFGERQEEGYIQGVEGFPLIVKTMLLEPDLRVCLECDVEYELDPERIGALNSGKPAVLFFDEPDILWTVIHPDGSTEPIPARLSGPCMASLHGSMEANEDQYLLHTPQRDYAVCRRSPGDLFQTIDLTPPSPEDNPVE